jgi:hypothetical protein
MTQLRPTTSAAPRRPGPPVALRACRTLLALAIVGAPALALAHAEHYGQAAYLRVTPDQIELELDLSPGSRVAAGVLARIDTNKDNELSVDEQRAYAASLLPELSLAVDGVPRALSLSRVDCPPASHLATGEAKLTLVFVASLAPLAPGPHRLEFGNLHAPVPSNYLAHAFGDRAVVTLGKPTRDPTQQHLAMPFEILPGPARPAPSAAPAASSSAASSAPRGATRVLLWAGALVGAAALAWSRRAGRG